LQAVLKRLQKHEQDSDHPHHDRFVGSQGIGSEDYNLHSETTKNM